MHVRDIPDDTVRALRNIAATEGLTLNTVIQRALTREVRAAGRRQVGTRIAERLAAPGAEKLSPERIQDTGDHVRGAA